MSLESIILTEYIIYPDEVEGERSVTSKSSLSKQEEIYRSTFAHVQQLIKAPFRVLFSFELQNF